MTDREKPTAGFWITVALVAVLVGYPLSIGPAAWICTGIGDPYWAVDAFHSVYAPILWIYHEGPESFNDALTWYCNVLP
jgi:hypothetical protein